MTSTSTPPDALFSEEVCLQDLQHVEDILKAGVRSSLELPKEMASRLIGAGGKRLRPLLVCLSYRAFSKSGLAPRASITDAHHLAAVSELVHMATLFHDDVIDASPTRRDLPSAHMLYGNKNAILGGDFTYAEAFSVLMDRKLLEPSQHLAQTVKTIVEGELLQHRLASARLMDEELYLKVARAKTAALFAWCLASGAWMAGSNEIPQAIELGMALGVAFQMADDIADTFLLDADSCSAEDLYQWFEGAAPLPLVKGNLQDKRIGELWKDILLTVTVEERRSWVLEMQRRAIAAGGVEKSESAFESQMSRARRLMEALKIEDSGVARAADLIEGLAEQGFHTAQSSKWVPQAPLSSRSGGKR